MFKKVKLLKKINIKVILLLLLLLLLTLVSLCFYRYKEGIDNMGLTDYIYNSSNAVEPSQKNQYYCQLGMGASSDTFLYGTYSNSYDACADECDDSSGCKAFDYTLTAKAEACRLYKDTLPWTTTGNTDNRQYCQQLKPYKCQVGQGNSPPLSTSNSITYKSCANECDLNKDCGAFDFTTKNKGNYSCRLFEGKVAPRESGGSDNRQYCKVNNGNNY